MRYTSGNIAENEIIYTFFHTSITHAYILCNSHLGIS